MSNRYDGYICILEKSFIPGYEPYIHRVVLWCDKGTILSLPESGFYDDCFEKNTEFAWCSKNGFTNNYRLLQPMLIMAQWDEKDDASYLRHVRQSIVCPEIDVESYVWDYIIDDEARYFLRKSQVIPGYIRGGVDRFPPFHKWNEVCIANFKISGTQYFKV